MFGDFIKKLTAPSPVPLVNSDARLALTALLVRVARTDGVYDATEVDRINLILANRYGLDPSGIDQLRSEAETLESEAPDTVRFTRAIKDAVAYEERITVIEGLWQVVMADGVRDAHENATLRLVASLLGVTDRDSNLARQRVSAAENMP